MIDLIGEKTIAIVFKVAVIAGFGWFIKDSTKRPTREEVSREISQKIKTEREYTQVQYDNIKEDVTEIKTDVKKLLSRR